jgi:hypothetical protein
MTVSLTEETFADVSGLADDLGCSRSALVEVLLARGLLKHYRARLAYAQMQADSTGPTKRYRGDSIREIEETIDYLETNYQGELWDAIDLR